MIPAPFEHVPVRSVDEAVAALATHGVEARLLAGGHSLLPLMKLRLAEPTALVDVTGVTAASFIRLDGDEVVIGALTRHRELERSDLLRREVPILAHAASLVGDPQVRNRGTIGGSLAHADPAADLPAVVLALDATMVARSPSGERRIDAGDFFTGFWESALQPGEMLTEVRLPRVGSLGWSYQKFHTRAQDWATVGCAVVGARVALVHMAATTMRARATEAALTAGRPRAEAAALAAEGTDPPTDLRASSEYRRALARVLVDRGLAEAGVA